MKPAASSFLKTTDMSKVLGRCFCKSIRFEVDGPDSTEMRAHIWTEDKPAWMKIGDKLPVYKKNIG